MCVMALRGYVNYVFETGRLVALGHSPFLRLLYI